ncbi:MAG: type II secretion system major pseudopilin GspG [Thermodesulfobacteriota bacterium]
MERRPAIRRPHQAGFSLIELMVVIVILGLLATMLVPRIMDRPDEARATKAMLDIRALESALKLYKLDNGFYPTSDQGLAALVAKPGSSPTPRNWNPKGYLDSGTVPLDPWGYDYIYRSPGSSNRDYDILSLGADGRAGGDGVNRDIASYDQSLN